MYCINIWQGVRSGLHFPAMRFYGQKCQVVKLSSCEVVRLSGCQVVKLSGCQVVKFDPWGMLNNFCFDVYAQKSMFIGENGNGFLGTTAAAHPWSPDIRVHRAGWFPAKTDCPNVKKHRHAEKTAYVNALPEHLTIVAI